MNYIKIEKYSTSNGPGVRVVLWCAGCHIGCPGCQNPEAQKFDAGQHFDDSAYDELLAALNHPYIQGLTISGGHPLEPENIGKVRSIMRVVRMALPDKDIWLYTGYKWEDIVEGESMAFTLGLCDVVVDGPYIESQRNIALPYRGSNNQRVIDAKKSLAAGHVVLYEEP